MLIEVADWEVSHGVLEMCEIVARTNGNRRIYFDRARKCMNDNVTYATVGFDGAVARDAERTAHATTPTFTWRILSSIGPDLKRVRFTNVFARTYFISGFCVHDPRYRGLIVYLTVISVPFFRYPLQSFLSLLILSRFGTSQFIPILLSFETHLFQLVIQISIEFLV